VSIYFLKTLFENSQVSSISMAIEDAKEASSGAQISMQIIPGEGCQGEERVLSFGQLRMWALDRIEGGTASYNMPAAFKLNGKLDVAALNKSFVDVLLRHEPLRTLIIEDNGEPHGRLRPVFEEDQVLNFEDLTLLDLDIDEDNIFRTDKRRSLAIYLIYHLI